MKSNKAEIFYILGKSPFGVFVLLWTIHNDEPKIYRILLPNPIRMSEKIYRALITKETEYSCPEIDDVAGQMESFMNRGKISFSLDLVRLDLCTEFQQKVLRAEHRIPYGHVSTYKRIAVQLGQPTASRAVGNALANNPFPIIIPCHRAIRTDLSLGGFQGGEDMKRALLEFEGNQFNEKLKIKNPLIYY